MKTKITTKESELEKSAERIADLESDAKDRVEAYAKLFGENEEAYQKIKELTEENGMLRMDATSKNEKRFKKLEKTNTQLREDNKKLQQMHENEVKEGKRYNEEKLKKIEVDNTEMKIQLKEKGEELKRKEAEIDTKCADLKLRKSKVESENVKLQDWNRKSCGMLHVLRAQTFLLKEECLMRTCLATWLFNIETCKTNNWMQMHMGMAHKLEVCQQMLNQKYHAPSNNTICYVQMMQQYIQSMHQYIAHLHGSLTVMHY